MHKENCASNLRERGYEDLHFCDCWSKTDLGLPPVDSGLSKPEVKAGGKDICCEVAESLEKKCYCICHSTPAEQDWSERFDREFGRGKPLRFENNNGTITVLDNVDYSEVKSFIKETLSSEKAKMEKEMLKLYPNSFSPARECELVKQAKEDFKKLISEWDRFSCGHSNQQHNSPDDSPGSDCPGWSEEDDRARGVLLDQIMYELNTK